MPSFGGANIFGAAVTMQLVDNPRGAQQNAYPGLNGMEELDQGLRGRFTIASGRLGSNSSGSDLLVIENGFRSFNDGNTYTLIDQGGFSWDDVKLESFEPQGRIEFSQDLDGSGPVWHRRYTARFRHLT